MPTRVQLPDGNIGEFPDGMSQQDIEGVLAKQYPQQTATPPPPQGPPPPKVGSLTDTISNVGTHLKNMVMGPINSFMTPPEPGVEQGIANTQMGQTGVGLYRMFAKPSVDAISSAHEQFKKGNLYSNDEYDSHGNYTPSAFSSAVDAIPIAGPWARNVETEAHQQGMVPALAGLATDISPAALPKALPPVGRAMQSAGEGVINKTVGALKKDFARGGNPGKGYFQAKLGPSASMGSIAAKASSALDTTGQNLGDLYDGATAQGVKIPVQQVQDAIDTPVNETRNVVMGPGGTGDAGPINQFHASFNPPIQAAQASGGFSPSDLFGVKKNVAKNTNWSDPAQVGMKQLRQQTTGAIGGVLTDNVPGTDELNSQYQNLLNLGNRASDRALTGSSPLTHLATRGMLAAGGAMAGHAISPMAGMLGGVAGMALDSIPAKTGLASALYYGGKGAVAVGDGVKGLYASPAILPKQQKRR